MVQQTLGPDEQVYLGQAKAFRAGGFSALRDLGAEFADEPTLKSFPSPLRWLWASLVGLTLPLGETFLQVTAAAVIPSVVWFLTHSMPATVLAAASPLTLTLCRRRLQDVPVALATLLAVLGAQQHSVAGVAVALFVTLSLKEASLLAFPAIAAAWLVSGGAFQPLVMAILFGVMPWTLSLQLIFGTKNVNNMLRTSTSGHATRYAAEHQSGAPHRLLVDLVLVSPCAMIAAILGAAQSPALAAAAVALIAAHAAAPIRNVRFIVAADVLLRAVGALALPYPFIALPALLAVDAYIAWRIRHVYDPVTQALATALGMPSVSAK